MKVRTEVYPKNHYTYFLVGLLLLGALLLSACQPAPQAPAETPADAPPPAEPTPTTLASPTPVEIPETGPVTPSVTASDQEIADNTVTVDEVVSEGAGWIVIHADSDGSPGPDIGHAAVEEGENTNVVVEIDAAQATETLYAMLHVDAGTPGVYEFPGDDVPVMVDGQLVNPSFQVTGGMEEATPSVSVEDQDVIDGTVTIDEVVSSGPGWLVIHAESESAPGPVIGHAAVDDGENTDVVVEIDASSATQTLYAMLHTDAGVVGEYEFPGEDTPVQVDGQAVTPPFMVTGGLPPMVLVEDQAVEDGAVTILQVVSEGPGWIVIHSDSDGSPGPDIGHAAVEDGINTNVAVEIDEAMATETLHAMLHIDADPVGEYNFPGDDAPARVDDEVVMEAFTVEQSAEGDDYLVNVNDSSFSPGELQVPAGTTVVWTSNASLPHTVTAADGSFDSGTMSAGDTFEYTFNEAGTFEYFCQFHGSPGSGMAGAIVVTP